MTQLLDSETRARMGRAARAFAVANRVDEPFTAVLNSDALRRRLRKQKKAAESRALPRNIDEISHYGDAEDKKATRLRAANELSAFDTEEYSGELTPGAAD
jgi:hypothetical protein